MSTRITKTTVQGMFLRTVRAATDAGIDASAWKLRTPGATDGYGLIIAPYGSLSMLGPTGDDSLGVTAREAYDRLFMMARTLELVVEIKAAQRGKLK